MANIERETKNILQVLLNKCVLEAIDIQSENSENIRIFFKAFSKKKKEKIFGGPCIIFDSVSVVKSIFVG